jgi:hypothetical protein
MGNIVSTWRRSADGKAYGRFDGQAGGASVKNFSDSSGKPRTFPLVECSERNGPSRGTVIEGILSQMVREIVEAILAAWGTIVVAFR